MPARKTRLHRRDYPVLEELGELLPRKAIAARLGMLRRDFDRALKADPNALLRLEAGEAKREAALVKSLMEKAKGSKSPLHEFFLLKTLHGYIDSPKPEPVSQTNIQVMVPRALTEAEYAKTITATVEPVKQLAEGGDPE